MCTPVSGRFSSLNVSVMKLARFPGVVCHSCSPRSAQLAAWASLQEMQRFPQGTFRSPS